jgi:formylglycine-generating enzyme required for sulfatase activity
MTCKSATRTFLLQIAWVFLINAGPTQAQEKLDGKERYPIWDGKETVLAYAKRTGLEQEMTLDLGDGVKVEFVLIPAGKFTMGSPTHEVDRSKYEGPQHEVTIGNPFYMGKYEVTQEQYEKLIKLNPSELKNASNPVEMVSWDDARRFCTTLGRKTGRNIRLPSEAEWEYACRAGSKTPFHPPRERQPVQPLTEEQRRHVEELISRMDSDKYSVRDKAKRDLIEMGQGIMTLIEQVKSSDLEVQTILAEINAALQPKPDLDKVAWFHENSVVTKTGRKPYPVGGKAPNLFGLHDMHGNVYEWCEDDWHEDYTGAPVDGSAWIDNPRSNYRVVRSSSLYSHAKLCRSAIRYRTFPEDRTGDHGFRIVMSLQ